ncbi:SAF domain protein [Acidimicrobium ferrooxidans DSM 10331]|uniref:SAF domain protein n=1 Tax=Acidimicrobium ferrooxidans (strain DSM 10331 / JCM 15462 / NBRC 103882 / ICP) TaxID=525909 RepID=C7LZP7_ACIFD|nr:RcpC/CpaB family pilus assembly protein [Acidimicrobium ferrooxidans]ACU54205.1 SAF domain protein [Acidimicrobium ferrooxidans DSM 10331]
MRSTTLLRGARRTWDRPAVRWPSLGSSALRIVGSIVLAGVSLALLVASWLGGVRNAGAAVGVVVTRPIPAGATIERADLGLASITVPQAVRATLLAVDDAVGRTAAVTIAPGTLLERSMVLGPRPRTPVRSITIAVPSTSVASGVIEPGDRVDVLATTQSASSPATLTIATQLLVLDVQASSGDELVTVATDSLDQALAIAQALATAKVDLVNATGVPGDTVLSVYPPSIAGLATHG